MTITAQDLLNQLDQLDQDISADLNAIDTIISSLQQQGDNDENFD